MSLPTIRIGDLNVSRLIVGGNPFSGISHQTSELNDAMRDYFTTARIKEVLAECEGQGINTFLGRCDNHICRLLREYWNEGGKIQFFAQTAPERASVEQNIRQAGHYGAAGCYLQGNQTQTRWEAGEIDEIRGLLDLIREAGMVAGVACHVPDILLDLQERGIETDFYMMCCYNLTGHKGNIIRHAEGEEYPDSDREKAMDAIRQFEKPTIAYKIMAAGRKDPAESFEFAFQGVKATDAVCVGMYPKEKPDMVAENARLALEAIEKAGT